MLQCRITRDKHGLDHGMYPIYHLHLECANGQKVCLYVIVKAPPHLCMENTAQGGMLSRG